MTTTQFNLDLNLLKFINTAAGKEERRPYLKGVFVEVRTNGVHLTATNGYILLSSFTETQTNVEEGTTVSFIVPSKTIEQIKAKKDCTLCVCYGEQTNIIELVNKDGTQLVKAVEGTYPDWRRVIPLKPSEGELGIHANFNWECLATIQKAAKLICNAKHPFIALGGYGSGQAHFLSIPSDHKVFGVIMPMRGNCTVTDKPEWV